MRVRDRLLDLFADEGWRQFFCDCCASGSFRLDAQAWQFASGLRERGHDFKREDVSDALFDLARELLPETGTGAWDEGWADRLMRHALAYLEEFYVEDADLANLDDEPITRAAKTESRVRYQAAVRQWTRDALREFRRASERGAA